MTVMPQPQKHEHNKHTIQMMFNAARFIKRLTKEGLTQSQAEVIAEEFDDKHKSDLAHLATRDQLDDLRKEIKQDMQASNVSLRAEIEKVHASLKTDMEKMQASLKTDMEKMQASLKTEFKTINKENRKIYLWIIGGAMAFLCSGCAAALAVLVKTLFPALMQ